MSDALGGMGGNWGLSYQHKGNAAVARANARIARAQGQAKQAQYEALAVRTEHDNKTQLQQAGDKMADLWAAGSKARGSVIAQRAASGFTEQGSGSMPEKSVLSQVEDQANAIAYASSLKDAAARYTAAMYRKSGDIAVMYAEADAGYLDAQASMYEKMARNAKRTGNVTGIVSAVTSTAGAIVGGIMGGPAGAYQGFKMGAQVGGMAGGVYGAGQMGSMQNLHGMSDASKYTAGNEFGNSLFAMSNGKMGFQSNDSFVSSLSTWLKK